VFTGLIEAVGVVKRVQKTSDVYLLSIECPSFAGSLGEPVPLALGQSVAVSGVCLTVTGLPAGLLFEVEMMPETAERTRPFAAGEQVNLERAMRADGRFDGHIVQGHVDGAAYLEHMSRSGRTAVAHFRTTRDAARLIVPKGSVALDGVSLTVIDASNAAFSVGLIPATLERCTLGRLRRGDRVNLETDVIGRYVERMIARQNNLTMEELRELGY
jgi:riboflavin synthase